MRINYVDILFLEWDKSIQKPYPYHYTWKCNSSELSGYIYLSIHLSIYLPIYLSIHPSIYLYLSISLSLSLHLSIYLSICNYVYIQPSSCGTPSHLTAHGSRRAPPPEAAAPRRVWAPPTGWNRCSAAVPAPTPWPLRRKARHGGVVVGRFQPWCL